MNCQHDFKKTFVDVNLLGNSKAVEIDECEKCNARVYGAKYEESVKRWLSELRGQDKLKVQKISVMNYTCSIIEELSRKTIGASISSVVHGILSFYFKRFLKTEDFMELAYSSYDKIKIKTPAIKKLDVKIRPVVARELSASMSLSGKTDSKLVGEILDLVLAPFSLDLEEHLLCEYLASLEEMVEIAA